MRILRALRVSAAVAVLAVAACGCGGGGGSTSYSGTAPDTWAADVCGALSGWAQGLQTDARALSRQLGNTKSLPTVKRTFVAFFEHAGKRTDTMISKVHASGAPAIKDGSSLQRDLEAGLRSARSSFSRAEARARTLSSTDPQAFVKGAGALGREIQKQLTAIGRQFDDLEGKYKNKKLDDAVASEPTCGSIGS